MVTISSAQKLLFFLLLSWPLNLNAWDAPPTGWATMTHYDLPRGAIAGNPKPLQPRRKLTVWNLSACGCTAQSSNYPTAALSALAYGSSIAFGPGCGRCYKLTLLNTFLSTPPFYPSGDPISIVVKITDLCPQGGDWCGATEEKPNRYTQVQLQQFTFTYLDSAGAWLNFDLAYPSPAIPDNFFPHNEVYYGYKDFGVWNVSYESVLCQPNWAGSSDKAAIGSVPSLETGGCCPAEPTLNQTCPPFSAHGYVPDTSSSSTLPTFRHNVGVQFYALVGTAIALLLISP